MGIDQIRPETKRKNEGAQGGQWIKMKLGSEKRRFLALDEIFLPFMTIYHIMAILNVETAFFLSDHIDESNRWS